MTAALLVNVVLLIVLIHLSAFFAGAETVFFSLNRHELRQFKESKKLLDQQVAHYLSKPKDFLVTILFGNEIVNIAISILVASLFYQLFPNLSIEWLTFLSVGAGTFLILLFGEVIPKSIGVSFATTLAPFVGFFLRPLYEILKPIRFLLVHLANRVINLFGGSKVAQTPLILEEEVRDLLELGTKSGEIAIEEQELIHKAFAFGTKTTAQIMTPIDLAFSLLVDLPYEELLQQIKSTQFSRVPIRAPGTDQFIGLLYVKDLFPFDKRRLQDPSLTIREILRPPLFVNAKNSLEEVLESFRQTRIHMAIVIDDQSKAVGLLTMHDVVEELFGEVEE